MSLPQGLQMFTQLPLDSQPDFVTRPLAPRCRLVLSCLPPLYLLAGLCDVPGRTMALALAESNLQSGGDLHPLRFAGTGRGGRNN